MNIERNIASSETTIVKSPNGKGSNGAIIGTKYPRLVLIHNTKSTIWNKRKVVEPQIAVNSSAVWVRNERERSDFASKDLKNWRRVSVLLSDAIV